MCDKCCCSNPEKLKDKPENCTAHQIAKCHPESNGHPCEREPEEKQDQKSECGS